MGVACEVQSHSLFPHLPLSTGTVTETCSLGGIRYIKYTHRQKENRTIMKCFVNLFTLVLKYHPKIPVRASPLDFTVRFPSPDTLTFTLLTNGLTPFQKILDPPLWSIYTFQGLWANAVVIQDYRGRFCRNSYRLEHVSWRCRENTTSLFIRIRCSC